MFIAYGMNKDGNRDYIIGNTERAAIDWAKENLEPNTYLVDQLISPREYEEMKRTCIKYREIKNALNKLFSFLEG